MVYLCTQEKKTRILLQVNTTTYIGINIQKQIS